MSVTILPVSVIWPQAAHVERWWAVRHISILEGKGIWN
nr:MAG TPA: hypothetical protein [Bacteriophage sp.]